MKLIVLLAFIVAVVAIGFCSQGSGAQDAPEMGFTSASQAFGLVATRWDQVDKDIDGGYLAVRQAASAAIKAAPAGDKAAARRRAIDDLHMKRMDLSMAVLRTELVNRDKSLAAALFQEDFPQRDRDQVNARSTARAVAARKRVADGYTVARTAISKM